MLLHFLYPPFPFKVDLVKADQPKRSWSCLLVDRNLGQIRRPVLKTLLPVSLQSHGWVLSRGGDVVPWRWIRIGYPHHDQVREALIIYGITLEFFAYVAPFENLSKILP